MLGLTQIESRALKYGYSNARVKTMKGFLLKQSALDDLIRAGSVEAMIELLQKTTYKGSFAEGSVRYAGSELIELAAAKSFAETVQKLIKITPKSDKPVVRALLIKYDLLNLKTMMHAKSLGKTYDEVRPDLVPVGGLSEDDFKRIMRTDGSSIHREIRRTSLGKEMLSETTAAFNKRMWMRFNEALRSMDSFLKLESVIDEYIYLLMDKALAQINAAEISYIRRILKYEIDAKNIMIIERLKKHGVDKNKIKSSLIFGGRLSDSLITKVIESKDIASTINLVKNKFLKLKVDKENADLTDLEIAFEKSIAAERAQAFYRSILSVGVIIGFLLLKEEEVNNLRKIAKGKEFDIPEKDIREMLVVV